MMCRRPRIGIIVGCTVTSAAGFPESTRHRLRPTSSWLSPMRTFPLRCLRHWSSSCWPAMVPGWASWRFSRPPASPRRRLRARSLQEYAARQPGAAWFGLCDRFLGTCPSAVRRDDGRRRAAVGVDADFIAVAMKAEGALVPLSASRSVLRTHFPNQLEASDPRWKTQPQLRGAVAGRQPAARNPFCGSSTHRTGTRRAWRTSPDAAGIR